MENNRLVLQKHHTLKDIVWFFLNTPWDHFYKLVTQEGSKHLKQTNKHTNKQLNPKGFNGFEYSPFYSTIIILLSTAKSERALQYLLYLGDATVYCNGEMLLGFKFKLYSDSKRPNRDAMWCNVV